ncbi:hypothetical protein GCM10010392_44730 [Streptomyces clavifer]|nr:hypothetical protein GCM10010392_44730 [Streptomyces clavifer]
MPEEWDAVTETVTFLVAVVPSTIGFPLLTTTLLITGAAFARVSANEGLLASVAGTARADRARAPETAATVAGIRI